MERKTSDLLQWRTGLQKRAGCCHLIREAAETLLAMQRCTVISEDQTDTNEHTRQE